MNRHFAPRNKSPTLRLDFCFPHWEMSSEISILQLGSLGFLFFFTCSIFFNMLSIFFAGRFWNGSLREAQLDAMLSVPPHESTCSLHTHPGCDLSRSGIPDSPLLSASQKGRFLMGHEPYGNIWNQCGNGCFMLFHMNFNEMWFSLKLMHMIWLRVQDGPNAQREGCARQIGGILTSSQLTFGLL